MPQVHLLPATLADCGSSSVPFLIVSIPLVHYSYLLPPLLFLYPNSYPLPPPLPCILFPFFP